MRLVVPAALLSIGVVAALTVGISASAQERGALTDAELVSPQWSDKGTQFFSEEQIDDVWLAVTKNYPEPMPDAEPFSRTAPEFFHPDDGTVSRFESGLVDLIAARYWRCAWLGVAIGESSESKKVALEALDSYAVLPSVAKYVNVDEYESQMREIAETLKTDPLSAEYRVECKGEGQ